jgi:hypothetical protein
MRYYRLSGSDYLENGHSLIRVGRVLVFPSPISKGRSVKIFEVVQVVKENPSNPIQRGTLLAVSFPNEQLNATAYTWKMNEECFIPYTITDHKTNVEAANRMAKQQRKLQAEANERAAEQPPPGP